MDETMGARARGGAAVGAGFGALLGAVIGWLLGAQVTDVPTMGPVVGQWVLSSTLVALGAGAGIGALIGALAAMSPVGNPGSKASREEKIAFTDLSEEPGQLARADDMFDSAEAASTVSADASGEPFEEQSAALASDEATPVLTPPRARPRKRGPTRAHREAAAASHTGSAETSDVKMEATDMSERDKGRDPSSFTGTEDAIDGETGALGTAGTPVTTGYGVSGSTVGTGTRRKSKKQEAGAYRGPTPDSAPYDVGGRDTGDAGVLRGSEQQAPVEEQYTDAGRVEANVPREREGRDVYEQSEGYVESLDRDELERPADSGAKESQGTNIAGTEDPHGLGDNTDGN